MILQVGGQSGEVTVTNDGATILNAIHIDNAAAKVLVDIAKTQDAEVGDGTTRSELRHQKLLFLHSLIRILDKCRCALR